MNDWLIFIESFSPWCILMYICIYYKLSENESLESYLMFIDFLYCLPLVLREFRQVRKVVFTGSTAIGSKALEMDGVTWKAHEKLGLSDDAFGWFWFTLLGSGVQMGPAGHGSLCQQRLQARAAGTGRPCRGESHLWHFVHQKDLRKCWANEHPKTQKGTCRPVDLGLLTLSVLDKSPQR